MPRTWHRKLPRWFLFHAARLRLALLSHARLSLAAGTGFVIASADRKATASSKQTQGLRLSYYDFTRKSLPTDAKDAQEKELFHRYMNAVLRYDHLDQWREVTRCLQKQRPSVMCQALAADAYVALDEFPQAVKALSAPTQEKPSSAGERRSALYLEAVKAWLLEGDKRKALTIFEQIALEWPEDIFAAKRAQLMALSLGDTPALLRALEPVLRSDGDKEERPFVHGMLAFALEENGQMSRALKAVREGMALFDDDIWLQHALAHVVYASGSESQAGVEALRSLASVCWDDPSRMSFIRSHCHWHMALFVVEENRPQEALRMYRDKVWGIEKTSRNDQLNALSLLWTIDMVFPGLPREDITPLWKDVVDHGIASYRRAGLGYLYWDLLLLRGVLEMKNRSVTEADIAKYQGVAEEMLAAMEAMPGKCKNAERRRALQTYYDLAEVMALFYFGYAGRRVRQRKAVRCAALMRLLMPRLHVLGASREQRLVFDRMYLDILDCARRQERSLDFLVDLLQEMPLKSLKRRLELATTDTVTMVASMDLLF